MNVHSKKRLPHANLASVHNAIQQGKVNNADAEECFLPLLLLFGLWGGARGLRNRAGNGYGSGGGFGGWPGGWSGMGMGMQQPGGWPFSNFGGFGWPGQMGGGQMGGPGAPGAYGSGSGFGYGKRPFWF